MEGPKIMGKKKILVLIPARYKSTRFPGKPLTLINSRPMIEWVIQNMSKKLGYLGEEFEFYPTVVTDDQRIEDAVKACGGKAVRVDDDVISGTLRIELAYQRFFSGDHFDLIVNVQGDEPLLQLDQVAELCRFHLSHHDYQIGTLVKPRVGMKKGTREGDDFFDPNKVKALFVPESGQCLYFSRSAIPYDRERPENEFGTWYLHIGVYSFKPSALCRFAQLPTGIYEDIEKLEQLKALENKMQIGAVVLHGTLMGVDHPEDVKKVEELLKGVSDGGL